MNDTIIDPEFHINPFSEKAIRIAARFDAATDKKDISELRNLIAEAQQLAESESIPSQAYLFYSIGTVYSDFCKIEDSDREKATEKQLYFFRKSIRLLEHEECADSRYEPYVLGLKQVLYTNYGNTLDSCGRKIAAIEQYKKVVAINKDFGMALGNLGRAYQHYGMLEYDEGHRDIFHHFAYWYFNMALNGEDPNTYPAAKKAFKAAIDEYDPEYVKEVLIPDLKLKQFTYEDAEEYLYRMWCLENGLFLNTLNDLPVAESCFAADVVQLPDIITDIDAKPIFHGMFSQLKQEYIYARYLYYSTTQQNETPHFADKETFIRAYTDYSRYSIRLEKLKTAFKTLYGLFDKAAFFLEHYFDLGIREREINFQSVWKTAGGGKKQKYQYKNVLKPNDNFALSSLYWIHKDFSSSFEDSPNPELKRIKDIRNALEHKYAKIIDDHMEAAIEKIGDGLALYIPEKELYDDTLMLLRILREVIINIALCVNIAEMPKREESKGKIVLPMTLLDYEDDWKM